MKKIIFSVHSLHLAPALTINQLKYDRICFILHLLICVLAASMDKWFTSYTFKTVECLLGSIMTASPLFSLLFLIGSSFCGSLAQLETIGCFVPGECMQSAFTDLDVVATASDCLAFCKVRCLHCKLVFVLIRAETLSWSLATLTRCPY